MEKFGTHGVIGDEGYSCVRYQLTAGIHGVQCANSRFLL